MPSGAGAGTAREVTEALAQRRKWAYSTVKTMLDRMVDKQLVRRARWARLGVHPAMPRNRAQRWAWRRFVDVAFGGAVAPTLQFVARETRLSRDERAQLRALLDQLEKDDE